jgi:uncharacterized protein YcaQ
VISPRTAARVAARGQGVDGVWQQLNGKKGVLAVIDRLGYVQIDSIAVVQRAHHHILWSRSSAYRPETLAELQERDRVIYEYWCGNVASYLPFEDYRYYLPSVRGRANSERTRRWLADHTGVVKHVLDRIRAEGPVTSADFPSSEANPRGSWWEWKPTKRALEVLFSSGQLMVARRRNFQRVYDLTSRVLPAEVDTVEPSTEEMARFVVRRAVSSKGVTPPEGIRWGHLGDGETIAAAVEELVDEGQVTPVRLRGDDDRTWYAWSEALEGIAGSRPPRRRARILSPFDSFVIDRNRLRDMFGFDFALECYLPAAKRRYGYFCLPVLFGDRFIARLDAKSDRRRRALVVRRLTFESRFAEHEAALRPLARELRSFASFNRCEEVVVKDVVPRKMRRGLEKALAAT